MLLPPQVTLVGSSHHPDPYPRQCTFRLTSWNTSPPLPLAVNPTASHSYSSPQAGLSEGELSDSLSVAICCSASLRVGRSQFTAPPCNWGAGYSSAASPFTSCSPAFVVRPHFKAISRPGAAAGPYVQVHCQIRDQHQAFSQHPQRYTAMGLWFCSSATSGWGAGYHALFRADILSSSWTLANLV